MGNPIYPLTPIVNIIAAILVLLSLLTSNINGPYNRGVVMLKGWVLVGVTIMSTQTILWHDSYESIAPVFCDISSHLTMGCAIGIPACSLILTRRLWHILAGNLPLSDLKARREAFLDYLIGLGAPALYMTIYYLVQGARFSILEGYGCDTVVYGSGVTIILLDVPPILISIASVVLYCWRICLYLYRHWHAFTEAMGGSTKMTRARSMRILALSLIDIIITLPVGVVVLFVNIVLGPKFPFWPGWTVIHNDWKPIVYTAQMWQGNPILRFGIYWNEWVNVVYALAIFSVFGTAGDAKGYCLQLLDGAKSTVRRLRRRFQGTGTPRAEVTTLTIADNLHLGASSREEILVEEGVVLDTLNGPDVLVTVTIGADAEPTP